MHKRLLQPCLSLLLSVAMLTGVGMPLFRHAHVDGESPHHHHQTTNTISRSKEHGQARRHEHSDECRCQLTDSGTPHVHFLWFCFEFSLPTDSEDDQVDETVVFVVLNQGWNHSVTDASRTNLDVRQDTLFGTAPFELAIAETLRQMASPQVAALPLCAKAVHKRSGVQLI